MSFPKRHPRPCSPHTQREIRTQREVLSRRLLGSVEVDVTVLLLLVASGTCTARQVDNFAKLQAI